MLTSDHQSIIVTEMNTIGFLQFLPTGQYGMCFGNLFSGLLPLRSLIDGPPFGVRFRESLVIRLHSQIDQIHLTTEAQCGTACLPLGDCYKHLWLENNEAYRFLDQKSLATCIRTPSVNAQCRSMSIKILALVPMSINRNWSASIGINRHWETFRINAMILIVIDWHWALIGGVMMYPVVI